MTGPNWKRVSAETIDFYHNSGIGVYVWTVNDMLAASWLQDKKCSGRTHTHARGHAHTLIISFALSRQHRCGLHPRLEGRLSASDSSHLPGYRVATPRQKMQARKQEGVPRNTA